MIFVGFATKNLQMLGDGRFDFRIAGKRTAVVHAQPLGGFLLGDTVVANSVVDDDTRGLLCHDPPFTFRFAAALSFHCS